MSAAVFFIMLSVIIGAMIVLGVAAWRVARKKPSPSAPAAGIMSKETEEYLEFWALVGPLERDRP